MLKEKLEKVKPKKIGMPVEETEYFPSFSLDTKTLEDIKDWEVGEDYYVVLKLTQKSKNVHEMDGKSHTSASFDIKEIGVLGEDEGEGSEGEEKKKLKNKYLS